MSSAQKQSSGAIMFTLVENYYAGGSDVFLASHCGLIR